MPLAAQSAVLPAFELVDASDNPVAPVVGENIDPVFGAFLFVRFVDPSGRPLLFQASAGGPLASPDSGLDQLFPPVPISDATNVEILYSNADCTGATYIKFAVPYLHYDATGVFYSAGRCESDGTKICIYTAPLTGPIVSANVASSSVGGVLCNPGSPGFQDAVAATEAIKVVSPFPWRIR